MTKNNKDLKKKSRGNFSKSVSMSDLPSESINRMLTTFDFKSPQIQEKAYTCLMNLLDGKSFGDITKISYTSVVKALELVLSRVAPTVTKKIIKTEKEDDMKEVFDLEQDVELKKPTE